MRHIGHVQETLSYSGSRTASTSSHSSVGVVTLQKAGKRGRTRGLVDMGLYPDAETWHYHRPHGAELLMDTRMTLTEAPGQSVYIENWIYKGRIVDFSLVQQSEETAGEYSAIAKYDCSDDEVHKHQYHKTRGEIKRTQIAPLRNDNRAWDTIDEHFQPCYDDLVDGWHENYRRWNE